MVRWGVDWANGTQNRIKREHIKELETTKWLVLLKEIGPMTYFARDASSNRSPSLYSRYSHSLESPLLRFSNPTLAEGGNETRSKAA
jgi:hypothetical protein